MELLQTRFGALRTASSKLSFSDRPYSRVVRGFDKTILGFRSDPHLHTPRCIRPVLDMDVCLDLSIQPFDNVDKYIHKLLDSPPAMTSGSRVMTVPWVHFRTEVSYL